MRADGSSSATRVPFELARMQTCVRFGWLPWQYDAMPDDDIFLFVTLTNTTEDRQAALQQQKAEEQARPAGTVEGPNTMTFHMTDSD